ncbi:putative transcriptional regulator, MarR family protein [Rhodococcoides trifolii]|uniref:Transcriptional regulator, MarR family protein n=1 Tax=Rhodococcoides trifolii TaxID=908250 RepID=A0A917G5E7_9NOCA|nr:putative transcriptional regulator, MarR family protein [Rhodococcus trifolii]
MALDRQVCFALHSASRATTAVYRPLLDELGITYPQYLVLLALWEQDGLAVGELGRRLELDSGTLSPLLKRLEQAGHLTRLRSTGDERRVDIHLTDTGSALRERAHALPECLFAASGLTEAEMSGLAHLLHRLTGSLRESVDAQQKGTP